VPSRPADQLFPDRSGHIARRAQPELQARAKIRGPGVVQLGSEEITLCRPLAVQVDCPCSGRRGNDKGQCRETGEAGAWKEGCSVVYGGLDSTTVLAMVQSQGFFPVCLSFDYGQRQHVELEQARCIAQAMGVSRHLVLRLELDAIGGSALTPREVEVPRDRVCT